MKKVKPFDLTEYNKLKSLLDEYNISYVEYVETENDNNDVVKFIHDNYGIKAERRQLIYVDPVSGDRYSDVVLSWFSYGHEKGLLEQMGLISEEYEKDGVEGYLDAKTVFERWAEHAGYFVKGLDLSGY